MSSNELQRFHIFAMKKLYLRLLSSILAALGFGSVCSCGTPKEPTDIEDLYGCPIEEYNDSIANE